VRCLVAAGSLRCLAKRRGGCDAPESVLAGYSNFLISVSREVDTLEITLHEEYDVVDRFFLVESMHAHKLGVNKPLLWDRLKSTPRFAALADKVTHIVVDDVDSVNATSTSTKVIWAEEFSATAQGLQGVMAWQASAGASAFAPTDIFISGHVDEILARNVIASLAVCEMKHGVTSGGLWMPMGNLNRAFRTDWPSETSLPHSIAMPTIYQFSELTSNTCCGHKHIPPFPGEYVAGGVHLTAYTLPVQHIIKALSCTECSGTIDVQPENLDAHQEHAYNVEWADRCIPVTSLPEKERNLLVYTPWFLACNPDRFPAWFGKPDYRTRVLALELKIMQTRSSRKNRTIL